MPEIGKRVLITGATGMIGSLVLQNCLESEKIESVVSLARRSFGIHHEKLEEVVVDDFLQIVGLQLVLNVFFRPITLTKYALGNKICLTFYR